MRLLGCTCVLATWRLPAVRLGLATALLVCPSLSYLTSCCLKGSDKHTICTQAPLKVGSQHVSASITILEDNSMPFLFGLDMLRRYQCSIDLHKNVLRFGSINNAELPFLAEHELPERLRRESSDVAGGGVGEGSASGPATLPNSAPGQSVSHNTG